MVSMQGGRARDRVGAGGGGLLPRGHAAPRLSGLPPRIRSPLPSTQGRWHVTPALVFMDRMQMAPGRSLPSRGTGSFSPRPPSSGEVGTPQKPLPRAYPRLSDHCISRANSSTALFGLRTKQPSPPPAPQPPGFVNLFHSPSVQLGARGEGVGTAARQFECH